MRKLALLFLLLPLLAAGCHHGMRAEVKGSGKRVMQKREISPFTSISTEGAFEIEVTCQKDPSVEVEGDDNVLEFVTAEVRGNELRLKSSKSFSTGEPVRFKITVPNLEGLSVSGPSTVTYRGDPVVNKTVNGPGKVEKRASEGA